MLPIFVASKGRPGAPTVKQLTDAGLLCTIVVEPQDAETYTEAWPNVPLWVLEDDDRGLAYVRQEILENARATGLAAYWMLDDDIGGFYRAEGGKCHLSAASDILAVAERLLIDDPHVGQIGLEYQQYAWRSRAADTVRNSYCDVAVAIRTDVLADFRVETGVKVDRDFTLQVLSSGRDTARPCWLAFGAPTNGSNKGGLADTYAEDGREREDSLALERLWPGVVEYREKKNGRSDAKIHWRRMRGHA